MIDLQLPPDEAKLAYLAIAYHLGRPGSELDPMTKQPVEHGLAEVARDLQPQLRLAVATISLNDDQLKRFSSGMLGSISELKTYPMLHPRDNGRRSSVPGFDSTLLHLFPEVEANPETTLDVAEQMLMMKRRLDQRIAALPKPPAPEPPPKKRGLWLFSRN